MNRNLFLAALALSTSLPALAADGLANCRAIGDTQRRLACYDALADAAASVAALPAAPARPAAMAAPATPALPARAATAATAATTTAAAATVAAPAPTADAAFGLPESRRPGAVASVDSTLSASFSGWGPNSRIHLANGQVWQVVDGTSVALPEGARKVSVKRGLLGSFYLDIEGLKTSPRVRRVE